MIKSENNLKHDISVENISPEKAAEWLAHKNFSGQRAVHERHINFLAETIRQQQFDGGSPIRIAVCGQNEWIVDGQHRLSAIISSGISVDCVVVRTHCPTPQQVAELYARIDRGRGRSINDALRGLGLVSSTSLNQTQINLLGTATPLIAAELSGHLTGSHYTSRSPEFRAKLIEAWEPYAAMFFAATDGATEGRLFSRREVMAIGLITFADAQEMAQQFWRGAAMDDGLSLTDPRKHLLKIMRSTKPTSNGVGLLAHSVAVCWNAWQRGDQMKLVRVIDARAPIKLLGTRYAKRTDAT